MSVRLAMLLILVSWSLQTEVSNGHLPQDNVQSRSCQIIHLYEKIQEPIWIPKAGGKVIYDLPLELLPKHMAWTMQKSHDFETRNDTLVVPIRPLQLNLTPVTTLKRGELFSVYVPEHRRAAKALYNIFMGYADFPSFISAAALSRDIVNEMLYVYVLSKTVLARKDLHGKVLPPIWEIFPEKFFDFRLIAEAKRKLREEPYAQKVVVHVPPDFSATDKDVEHRVAYFREDVGVNSHHWHWHLAYPTDGPFRRGERKGELFYYMHHQMIARYEAERLANRLLRTVQLKNWQEPIKEAYFPKLIHSTPSIVWGSRPEGMKLRDIAVRVSNRKLFKVNVEDLSCWRLFLVEAISKGYIINSKGQNVSIQNEGGIDILGGIVQSSDLSPNKRLYGDIHNVGHVMVAVTHDPDQRYKEHPGVMFDIATAPRDPVFYRWHKFIDNIFNKFKATLGPYDKSELSFPGIAVTGLEVRTPGEFPNVLLTGWLEQHMLLSFGLDFKGYKKEDKQVYASMRSLHHKDFTYVINITNKEPVKRQGIVRIFLSPSYDEKDERFTFDEQQLLMIEMDKFVVPLQPGKNTIRRNSTDSSVTIPLDLARRIQEEPLAFGKAFGKTFDYTGCGWPHNLLLPRGTRAGMEFQFFVMVTDWEQDKVDMMQEPNLDRSPTSVCGLLRAKYPDRRAMGFPFDRVPTDDVIFLPDFLTENMALVEATIRFTGKNISKSEGQMNTK